MQSSHSLTAWRKASNRRSVFATSKLYSDVARLLESMADLNPGQLSFTMQKVDAEIQMGFAMSANLQAGSVCPVRATELMM